MTKHMIYRITGVPAAALVGSAILFCDAVSADITLAEGGNTRYAIAGSRHPSAVDEYAVETLRKYLNRITGAEFPVAVAAKLGAGQPTIFVGLSDVALDRLGRDDPPADLGDEEHVCRSEGASIFLYGQGIHGQLWAVVEFLENSLGWRWYTPLEDPVVPSRPTLTLAPFHRKRGFSFRYRQMQALFNSEFYYLQGMNMGWSRKGRSPQYVSREPMTALTHTLFRYIPPTPDHKFADYFEWQDKKDYFATNPEFFSLNEHGKRVSNDQLCFSNPELRKALTANVIRDIRHAQNKGWESFSVTVTADDNGGRFCHCPGCIALDDEYQTHGGPILDYVIELGKLLEKEHPNVKIRTSAYRRSQTQVPPVLPDGVTLPANIVIRFSPIEDCYFADWWNHRRADVQGTFSDLLGWTRIASHVRAGCYPSPYGTGVDMPVALIERITNNFRLMHYAGVEGIFADHVTILSRSNFAELQRYLMFKLFKDIDCDADGVIREFTDNHYGAAGGLMRQYIDELEQCRIDMILPPGIGEGSYAVTYRSPAYDLRTFPYLTPEHIHRWQGYFDRMQERVATQPKALGHVQAERRELDLATLLKWLDVRKEYPDHFKDHSAVADRIRTVNATLRKQNRSIRALGTSAINEFLFNIRVSGREAPLPPELADVDPARIRQYIPRQHWPKLPQIIEAPDAALGFAAPVHRPDNPLTFGFFDRKGKKHGPRRKLAVADVTPGTYDIYELGEVTVTPDCLIWFSARSWQTHLLLGARLYEPGADNRWNAYASMKFDGPTYGGQAPEDRVLVDRVILVPASPDQFRE